MEYRSHSGTPSSSTADFASAHADSAFPCSPKSSAATSGRAVTRENSAPRPVSPPTKKFVAVTAPAK